MIIVMINCKTCLSSHSLHLFLLRKANGYLLSASNFVYIFFFVCVTLEKMMWNTLEIKITEKKFRPHVKNFAMEFEQRVFFTLMKFWIASKINDDIFLTSVCAITYV